MTTPNYIADGYSSATDAVYQAPGGQGDRFQPVRSTVTVPDNTTAGTLFGMMPFRQGARVPYYSKVTTTDLDTATNVTLSVGYVYLDNDTTTNINDVDAFVAASTTGQTGGVISFSAIAGASFTATADGWLVVEVTGGPVSTEGTLTFDGGVTYGA